MVTFAQVKTYIDEVVEELKKVAWPDRDQLRNATFVVLGFVALIAVIIWFMDLGVRGALRGLMNLFVG